MGVTFQYSNCDGRLICGLAVDEACVVHPVNGWHNGLRELVHAASEMFGRANDATAYFQEEPGEFRWRITRVAANRIRVRVIEFADWATDLPDQAGKLLFDQTCGVVAFSRAILEGYQGDLAIAERDRLRALLEKIDFSLLSQRSIDSI